MPVENEQLKRYARGPDKRVLRVFRNFVGILNGPVDLDGFKLLISSSISEGVVEKSIKLLQIGLHKYFSTGVFITGIAFARLAPILAK